MTERFVILPEQGIDERDHTVVIDRAAPLRRENIAVVTWEGELVVQIIHWDGKRLRVSMGTEGAEFQRVAPGGSLHLWGIVTYVLGCATRFGTAEFWVLPQRGHEIPAHTISRHRCRLWVAEGGAKVANSHK